MWTKRLIIFLIRKRLGLKKYQHFRFNNQKSNATYFFSDACVMKDERFGLHESSVSLNWLLNDNCKITIVGNAYKVNH